MVYRITTEPDLLRAELSHRETVEETRSFLRAVARENAKHRRQCILLLLRSSQPIFQVMLHRLVEHFEELSAAPSYQIALVGDTADLHMSHEYIELIARQRGLNVRSFRDEAAALQWLRRQRERQERRERRERRERNERRARAERRQRQARRGQSERRDQGRRAT